MDDSVRELAYKLWQIRSIKGIQTSSEQDWYDAERLHKQLDNKSNVQFCSACDSLMKFETRPEVITYKDLQVTINTLGWWCDKCGEGVLSGEALKAHERAFLELKESKP